MAYESKDDTKQDYNEWPKCSQAGCPIRATMKAENVTCSYHHGQHGLDSECTTEAVKEFVNFINKHNEMIHWNVRQWKEKRSQIRGWPVLPATEREMDLPSLYITRLKNWIDAGIIKRADEIYNGHE